MSLRPLVRDPNDFAILNNLGNVLWEQGRLDEAVQWFRPAAALRPNSPVVLMNLGVTLSDLGAFDEALGFIRESLRLLPDSPESHVNLGIRSRAKGSWTKRSRAMSTLFGSAPISPWRGGIAPIFGWLAVTMSVAGRSTNGD